MTTRPAPHLQDTIREMVQEAVPGVIAIYQFGSTVQGGEHDASDLDLAVLAQSPLDNLDRWKLQEDLAAEIGRDVDLVDLRSASTVMRAQVLRKGSILAELDRTARQQFEVQTCSAYALLNEERAGILKDVQVRGGSMADDVVLNKASVIERCLQRVEDEYEGDSANLRDDITRQDAIILNLQRACQAAIDLAMHLVREHGLGVPQESREAFALLDDAGHLDSELSDRLQRMVGFRNVAVHDYQDLNLDIVQSIVEKHLSDFTDFTEQVVKTDGFRTGN